MSGRELQRIEVLSEVLSRRRSEISAAAILGLSMRQTRRLLAAYRDGGGGALIHKARGRTSNNRLIPPSKLQSRTSLSSLRVEGAGNGSEHLQGQFGFPSCNWARARLSAVL
jgi:hypothetical protein